MYTIIETGFIYDIISVIAMYASDERIDDDKRIDYCHDKILSLTGNKDLANHAADCIRACIEAKIEAKELI